MTIYVLISTIDAGLQFVPDILLPEAEGVMYVVSWQQTKDVSMLSPETRRAKDVLQGRQDVTLTTLNGKGLCRNRNHAVSTVLSLLSDPLEDSVCLIADDDERLLPDTFERLRTTYARYPKMDGALMRLRSITDGEYFKHYPTAMTIYGHHPRSYYPCSCEMSFRTRVWQAGLRFDERFGLGAEELCAGEEDILLTDMQRKGLRVLIVPEDIGLTNPATTGAKVLDKRVLRSKGAVYGYQGNYLRAFLRSMREAFGIGLRHHTSPLRVFRELWRGVKYIRRCKHN